MDIAIAADGAPAASAGRWPFLTTVGWGILIFIVSTLLQGLVLAGFVLVDGYGDAGVPRPFPDYFIQTVQREATRGDVVWSAIVISDLASVAAILGIVRLKRQAVADYLNVYPVRARALLAWLTILVAFIVLTQGGAALLKLDFGSGSMEAIFKTTQSMWLPWAAVVIAGPLFEESLFRGFLFRGFAASRLGTRGAIALTAILWAAVHLQYNLYGMGFIAVAGILFGLARARTGSILMPLAMHATLNLFNTALFIVQGSTGGT